MNRPAVSSEIASLAADPEVQAALARVPRGNELPAESDLLVRLIRLEERVGKLEISLKQRPTVLAARAAKLSEATARNHRENPEFHAKSVANLSRCGCNSPEARQKMSEKAKARWARWRAEQAAKEMAA